MRSERIVIEGDPTGFKAGDFIEIHRTLYRIERVGFIVLELSRVPVWRLLLWAARSTWPFRFAGFWGRVWTR
ncbi:MAG: hypothetical protein KAX77_00400 [Xanthomonadales bacterium]|nr:hypothetical protein [Xanthomonadales bacterium]